MGNPEREELAFLTHIFKIKSLKTRRALLDTLTKNHLKLIAEILTNLLSGNIEVSKGEKEKLKKHKKLIRVLSSNKSGYKVRRKLLLKFPTVVTKIFRIIIPLVWAFIAAT
mgnify:CR=1 FL=1